MLASQNISACRARSVVRACTAVLSRAQLAKPYSRATASCAPARVGAAETARMRSAAAVSPDCAARSRSRASRRRWSRLGRAGRSAMTSPSPACDPRGRPTREIAGVLLPDLTEVDYVLPADPEAPSHATATVTIRAGPRPAPRSGRAVVPPVDSPLQVTARQVEQQRGGHRRRGDRDGRVETQHLGGQDHQCDIDQGQQPGQEYVPHTLNATWTPFRKRYG